MGALRLIYFEGCPNAKRARNLLRSLNLSFEEISQDALPESHPLKGYTSPTILDGENIIFGSKTDEGSGDCSIWLPSADELRKRLGLS